MSKRLESLKKYGLIGCLDGKMSDWISVKERFPDSPQCVYVSSDTHGQSGCAYWDGFFFKSIIMNKGSLMCHEKHEITHWMPLPNPPKDEK